MAVDHGTVQRAAHKVELVAELCHLVGRVLVTGDDLINGVEDHGGVAFFLGPADELWGQLVHGHGRAAQIPDVDVSQVLRGQAEGGVHVLEAMQAGGPVQLQIDVQYLALCAGETAQPRPAFGDGDAQFDEGKALARLAGACQQHLVALAQHSGDEGIGQRGQALPVVGQTLGLGQLVGFRFQPVPPLIPAGFPDVRFQQHLPFVTAQDAGHPGKAGRVAVLLVDGQAVFLAGGIEIIHTPAVLGVVRGIHLHDGVDALAARVDQRRTGQFQLLDDGLLFAQLHVVALHEGVAVGSNIGILASGAVHRVEADPCTYFRITVAHHLAEVTAAGIQLGDELPCGAGPAAFCRSAAVGGHKAFGHIGHIFIRLKQGLQVALELIGGMPLFGQGQLVGFHPAWIYQTALGLCAGVDRNIIVPVQSVACGAAPSVGVGQLEDAACGDGAGPAAVKAFPFLDALALVIAACIACAPLFPEGNGQTSILQCHAHHEPFVIGQGGRGYEVQCFLEFIFMFHSRYHPKLKGLSGAAGGSAGGT